MTHVLARSSNCFVRTTRSRLFIFLVNEVFAKVDVATNDLGANAVNYIATIENFL